VGLKTKIVTVQDGTTETNRDFGKVYLITEMPAAKAEKWDDGVRPGHAEQDTAGARAGAGRKRHRGNLDAPPPASGVAEPAYGFWFGRRTLDLGSGGVGLSAGPLAEYPNVPGLIGAALSTGLTSLGELTTALSVEDCYDLLEVAAVNAHNRRLARKEG
jgi:hypothetical protein